MNNFKLNFSQRAGLMPAVPDIAITGCMPESVKNAILSCYFDFCNNSDKYYEQKYVEKDLWIHFLNMNLYDFWDDYGHFKCVFIFFLNSQEPWYRKLDIVEHVCLWLDSHPQSSIDLMALEKFERSLNIEFERLNYGYRIVNHIVTDIISEEEILCVENAIRESNDNVKEHLKKAIEYYSKVPVPDCRNSIKESISAVEAVCRGLTGENTLGKALSSLESKGVAINPQLKSGLNKLYDYTNQPGTGIRHSLMDNDNVPTKAEAYFMLVSCSAFVNYLRMISVK